MPRLFTAIELPDGVRELLKRLRTPLPGAKWIEPDNLHLTLRFAGDIDNMRARELVDALAQIDADAFEITISGLGAFGGHEPHTLYAAVEPAAALDTLARANERAARQAGLAPEGRTFKPHISLARFKYGSAEAVARFLGRNGAFRLEPFPVDSFVLLSSRPNVGGGPYVIEERFELKGAYSGFDWAEPGEKAR